MTKRPGEEVATPSLIQRLRSGGPCEEIGNRCRIMDARSGCICAEAADAIELAAPLDEECMGHLREMYDYLSYKKDHSIVALDMWVHIEALNTRLGFKPDREGK